MYKIRFRLGLRPIPYLRSLQGSPDPWLHLRGPISKGRGREGEGRVNEGEKEGRKRSLPPNLHHKSTPLYTCTKYHTEQPPLAMAIICRRMYPLIH